MAKYIDSERIERSFDGIYDCADLVFEPNDHCCAADDCGHCKWYEAKNAIAKRILSIPAADVRPVVFCKDCIHSDTFSSDNIEATFPLKCLFIRYGGVYPDWFCEHGEKREGS